MSDRLDVIGLGLATLDLLLRMEDLPTWERGGSLLGFRYDGGGLVATAMVAVAKLGVRAGFVGTAGSDESATLKLRQIMATGVDLSRLVRRPGPEARVMAVFVHGQTGERAFAGMSGARDEPLTVDELDRAYLTSAPYLHLDGFHAQAAMQAAAWVRRAGGTVLFDASLARGPIAPHKVALLPQVDICIGGQGFAHHLTGLDDLYAAGQAVLEWGPRVYVETRGADGCYTVTADERFHTPAFPVHVVDTTGAGDVFHGAYIVGLLKGWSLREVARFAAAVAAVKCTQLGGQVGIPTMDETMRFLESAKIMQDTK